MLGSHLYMRGVCVVLYGVWWLSEYTSRAREGPSIKYGE